MMWRKRQFVRAIRLQGTTCDLIMGVETVSDWWDGCSHGGRGGKETGRIEPPAMLVKKKKLTQAQQRH
jgi:hypothetical protein